MTSHRFRSKRFVLPALGIGLALAAGSIRAELDFSDFDDLLMQSMEDTMKALEPHIGAKDITAATDDADFLREGLQWVESYFAAKGVGEAVEIAKEGQQHVALVAKALAASDFTAAATAARAVAKTCRTCHDAYRP